jgi:quercetin dioxygenase-like cupin family protein
LLRPSGLHFADSLADHANRGVAAWGKDDALGALVVGVRPALEVVEALEFAEQVVERLLAHSHDGYEETIYGLEGVLTWTVEGTPTGVGPGEALFIPRGAVHHFENSADVDATALAIVTPGILGPDYFREVASILDAAVGPPDLAAIAAVMRRHGLTPAS